MIRNLDYFTVKLFLSSSTQFQRSFRKFCSKNFNRFLCECCKKTFTRKFQRYSQDKLHRLKNLIRKLVSKNTSCEARRFLLAVQKGLYILNIVGNALLGKFSESIELGKKMSLYLFHYTFGSREHYNFLQSTLSRRRWDSLLQPRATDWS